MRIGSLVIGCGYVGTALVRQLCGGDGPVFITARSPARVVALAGGFDGVHGVAFDTAGTSSLAHPLPCNDFDALDVFCLLTPSALATAALRARLFDWLRMLPVRRAVLSSSTGVYGEHAGAAVGPETPIMPATPRERRLFDIEQAWLRATRGRLVRLAGLYGPGRIIGLAAVRAGELLPGQPMTWLNLLHRDDAAGALRASMQADAASDIEVASDGTPVRRATYYAALAGELGAPVPRFAESPDLERCGKAIDPRASFARLGWAPRFPDFRAGLRAALEGA